MKLKFNSIFIYMNLEGGMRGILVGMALVAAITGGMATAAQGEETMEQRLQRLEAEIERLGSMEGSGTESASSEHRVSWHGYGELHYNNPKTGSKVPKGSDQAAMDLHRMVWGLSYMFNDRISLHTEVDFEHAARDMELEFAYLDFLWRPGLNFRAGSVLMPVGPLNEFHEPTLFYSIERPYVQAYIIPTTWQEGGVGIFGSLGEIKYRVYAVSGLNAKGFSDDQGIRGGRGKVAGGSGGPPITGQELAFVGRAEYVGLSGLALGVSGYQGGANQTEEAALDGVRVKILEADLRYRLAGLDLRGVWASVRVDGAEKVSTAIAKTIGEQMLGWYVEAGYNVLPLLSPGSDHSLVPFVRYETFDTQRSVPTGLSSNPANDRTITTLGVAYYPHPDVVLKTDWEQWEDGTDAEGSRVNLGIGYQF